MGRAGEGESFDTTLGLRPTCGHGVFVSASPVGDASWVELVSAAILCTGGLSCDPKVRRDFLQNKFQCPPMVGV